MSDHVNPTALLLDLDGTLIDSEPIHRAAYRAFFAERGWEVPDLTMFTGRRAEDVFVVEPGPWTGQDPAALSAEIMACVHAGGVHATSTARWWSARARSASVTSKVCGAK